MNPKSGAVVLDGENISKESTKILAKKMAILPQTPESASGLTVGELVSYGRFPYQKGFGRLTKKDYEVIDWSLEVTGIFLDEPTTYLDMAHQLEVLELLQMLNEEQERTIVMVLHDLNQAARFADYIIALKDGEIVKFGDCEEVMKHDV